MSRNRRDKKRRDQKPEAVPPRPATRLVLVLPPNPDDALLDALPEALGAGDVASVILWSDGVDPKALEKRAPRVIGPARAAGAAALLGGDEQLVARLGFDGLHVDGPLADLVDAIERLRPDRIVGAGNLRSRHEAMEAGEAGADYVFFGHPFSPDGKGNAIALLAERAAWWQALFEIPCVVLAPSLADVGTLAEAGADFVALAYPFGPDARDAAIGVERAQAAIDAVFGAGR